MSISLSVFLFLFVFLANGIFAQNTQYDVSISTSVPTGTSSGITIAFTSSLINISNSENIVNVGNNCPIPVPVRSSSSSSASPSSSTVPSSSIVSSSGLGSSTAGISSSSSAFSASSSLPASSSILSLSSSSTNNDSWTIVNVPTPTVYYPLDTSFLDAFDEHNLISIGPYTPVFLFDYVRGNVANQYSYTNYSLMSNYAQTKTFSYSIWVSFANGGSTFNQILGSNLTHWYFQLLYNGGWIDQVSSSIWSFSPNTATYYPSITNYCWYHLVTTFDSESGATNFYVDGQLAGSSTMGNSDLISYNTDSYPNYPFIGGAPTLDYSWNGMYTQYANWDIVLAPTEVLNLYNQQFAAPSPPYSGFDGFDIIVQIGQSNEFGCGNPANYTLDSTIPYGRIYQYNWGTNQINISPVYQNGGIPFVSWGFCGVGHVMTFARNYVTTIPANRSVMIVNPTAGGTGFNCPNLQQSWLPPYGSYYQNAMNSIPSALAFGGYRNRIIYFSYTLGECDTGQGCNGECNQVRSMGGTEYTGNVLSIFHLLRSQANASHIIPVVLHELPPFWISSIGSAGAIIQNAIDNMPTYLNYSAVTSGSNTNPDQIAGDGHYDAPSQRLLGFRDFNTTLPAAKLGNPNLDTTTYILSAPTAPTNLHVQSSTSSTIVFGWVTGIGIGTVQDFVFINQTLVSINVFGITSYTYTYNTPVITGYSVNISIMSYNPLGNSTRNPSMLVSINPTTSSSSSVGSSAVSSSSSIASSSISSSASTSSSIAISGNTNWWNYSGVPAPQVYYPFMTNTNDVSGDSTLINICGSAVSFVVDSVRGNVASQSSYSGYGLLSTYSETTSFTAAIWVYLANGGNTISLIWSYNITNGYRGSQLLFGDGSDNHVIDQVTPFPAAASPNTAIDSIGASANVWYHVVTTFNATTGNTVLYLNGISVASSTMSSADLTYYNSITNPSYLYIGGNNLCTNSWNGLYNQYENWNTVLSLAEIRSLYNGQYYVSPIENTYSNGFYPFINSVSDSITGNTGQVLYGSISYGAYSGRQSAALFDTSALSINGYLSSSFSVCAWINFSSYVYSLSNSILSGTFFLFAVTTSGAIYMAMDPTTSVTTSSFSNYYITSSSGVVSLNQWSFVCGTYNQTTNTGILYYNGIPSIASGSLDPTWTGSVLNNVGTSIGFSYAVDGYIQCLQWTNLTLSATAINSEYTTQQDGTCY